MAWRQFVFETVLCVTLVVAIAILALGAARSVLAGVAIIGLASALCQILWRREPPR